MGFVVPPLEYHIGLPRWEHWRMQEAELDVVLYSLDKAIRLLLKSNPNIVGLLWLRDEEYVYQHPAFAELLAQRSIFSSQVVAEAFAGYAQDQLKRMEAFNIERMAEYEALISEIKARGALREVLEADAAKLRHIGNNWQVPLETLNRFRKLHHEHFSGYMGEKRKAMVRKYEYDVKNAAHLIRLLRMGREFLETGELKVYRTKDAAEFMSIKRGAWTLAQVKEEAAKEFARVKGARARSRLPSQPDSVAANALLQRMQLQFLACPQLGDVLRPN